MRLTVVSLNYANRAGCDQDVALHLLHLISPLRQSTGREPIAPHPFCARARGILPRCYRLFGALVGDMALNVHPVVEDAHDFDNPVRPGPVHQEMASATAMPRNVKRAKACQDLVASPGARNIGT